jgi:high affinity Mn2+ porin
VDRSSSAGLQLQGALWGRDADHAGLAGILNGLSPSHEEYLAAGGYGFIVGDGALNYDPEQIFELYYSYSPFKGMSFSPDWQYVRNPGYNQDRGPVSIYALRCHYEF